MRIEDLRALYLFEQLSEEQLAALLAASTEVPFAEGAALAVAWPGAALVPLAGVGHSRALRDPAVIARAVSAIVDGHAPVALSA